MNEDDYCAVEDVDSLSADAYQEGGSHYVRMSLQPWAVMKSWMSANAFRGYLRGNVIKYLARFEAKGGIVDLRKARHYLDKLIEETEKAS